MFLPPVGRLETLVEQALVQQTKKCVMHNAHAKPASLYRDYVCGEEQPLISSSDSEEEEEEEEEAEEEE
jgi:CO dehydrogenase/acetyl-CoA synthase beta subunit